MTTFHHAYPGDNLFHLIRQFDELPTGCDPDFDDGTEELERQFAELRLSLDRA